MNIYDEPKIDCHNHLFDPVRFPYPADAFYRPAGPEVSRHTNPAMALGRRRGAGDRVAEA